MRTIKRTSRFRRDYRREAGTKGRAALDGVLRPIVDALANDQPLQDRHHDHALVGDWAHYRDCHVRPDLVLIYRKPDTEQLFLTRLGSHAQVFRR